MLPKTQTPGTENLCTMSVSFRFHIAHKILIWSQKIAFILLLLTSNYCHRLFLFYQHRQWLKITHILFVVLITLPTLQTIAKNCWWPPKWKSSGTNTPCAWCPWHVDHCLITFAALQKRKKSSCWYLQTIATNYCHNPKFTNTCFCHAIWNFIWTNDVLL